VRSLRSLFAVVAAAALVAVLSPQVARADAQFVPVLSQDFPDPFILMHGGRFMAYATNSAREGVNVQMATSTNLTDWQMVRDDHGLYDAMPVLPPWARRGSTWAPEVLQTDGGFVLYFTARHRQRGVQCVGAATSADPIGPFVSQATEPLVCQYELGGTIDASPFRDSDGQLYLYFKNDGNAVGKATEIFAQRLAPDGLSLVGERVSIERNDADWEGWVIEAPTMVRTDSGYALLYSGNDYAWQDNQRLSAYAIGYASCQSPMGPCTDAPANPILHSFNERDAGCLSGPGHQTVFQVGTRSFLAFHAWAATPGCRKTDARRYLYISPLAWRDGAPVVAVSLRPQGERH
jgi:beta-xylosidase